MLLRSLPIVLLTLGIITGAALPVARAQTATGPHIEKARELAAQATAKYQVGHFDGALRLYEQAYEVHPSPVLIFNIAQCHRQLGKYERAAFLYKSFLRVRPDAPNRAQVEEIIAELERLVAGQRRAGSAPPEGSLGLGQEGRSSLPGPTATTSAPLTTAGTPAGRDEGGGSPWYRRWWVWTIVGVAVVGAAVGGAVAATRGAAPQTPPRGTFPNMTFTFGGG